MKKPFVSVCIIFPRRNPWLDTCVKKCLALSPAPDEIVLVPDDHSADAYNKNKKIRVVVSGPSNIPQKRNISVKSTSKKCDIIAFIDDDVYPHPDWMKNGLKYLTNELGAVGGPNLTPPEDTYWMKVTGNAMESPLGYGNGYIRHVPVSSRFVEELPTCNLFVWKKLVEWAGYFDETLVTGEDARLCADIRRLGKKIAYRPDVRVYHHRRPLFKPFMVQMYKYGFFKGKLFRKSALRQLYYLVPALFFVFVILGWMMVFNPWLSCLYKAVWVLYGILLVIEGVRNSKRIIEFPFTMFSLFVLHMSYGWGFVRGVFSH
ncbi:MAG: glycosyltransferase family 2 protein [Nanoarchaeota archaeon]